MDHAALGRRKLEEIRQKKSAKEQDQSLKVELEAVTRERDELRKKLEDSMAQVQSLVSQLNEAKAQASSEEKAVETLKQSVKTLSLERDAAVTAKEDFLSQLRSTRRRLQEAEEEQYRAEEDAAVLRAELKHLREAEAPPTSSQSYDLHSDQQLDSVRAQLQSALSMLQQMQQNLTSEQQKCQKLAAEQKELELALASAQSRELAEKKASEKWKSKVDAGKYEQHVRELASMVERLESGRQKLLAEIDRQSLEIEKLFMLNDALENGLEDAKAMAVEFEKQLLTTLKPKLEKNINEILSTAPTESEHAEVYTLKMELAKAIGQRDELDAKALQMSVELASAKHSLNILHQMLKPVLANVHSRLLHAKQNAVVPQVLLA